MTVSQGLRRKRKERKKKKRKMGPLADPILVGRPAEVTSANAYTLNLWAADEDRTLTERQRERGESECTIKRLKGGKGEEWRQHRVRQINKEEDNRMLRGKRVK